MDPEPFEGEAVLQGFEAFHDPVLPAAIADHSFAVKIGIYHQDEDAEAFYVVIDGSCIPGQYTSCRRW